MLKRIGFGLLVFHCSFLMPAIVGNVFLCTLHINVTCLFSTQKCSAYNLGFLLSVITLFEFVFAQTPHSIQGLITWLTALSMGLSSSIGYVVCKSTSIIFSIYTTGSLVVYLLELLELFVWSCLCVFSKHYKLQMRDDIVSIHLFAEEYLKRNCKVKGILTMKDFNGACGQYENFVHSIEGNLFSFVLWLLIESQHW